MWFTTQTERVIVLSKILALNKSLALLLSVLLAASVGTITIEPYRRISCHDNFVKAKDSSSRVREQIDDRILEHLIQTIKDSELVKRSIQKKWNLDQFLEEATQREDIN